MHAINIGWTSAREKMILRPVAERRDELFCLRERILRTCFKGPELAIRSGKYEFYCPAWEQEYRITGLTTAHLR